MSYGQTELGRFGTPGGDILLVVDVSPDAAIGNITITDVDYAYPIGVVGLIEDPDAVTDHATVQALKNSSTNNQIDLKLWASPNVAAATFKDFRLLVLCKDTAI
jgi:hypothetical protein